MADQCIWLRKAPNLRCYKYIAVSVDDLYITAESPRAIIELFNTKYRLKVKGNGKLSYYLGGDYFQDPSGTFVSQPKKYIDMLTDTYERLSMKIRQKARRPFLPRMTIQSSIPLKF